MRAELQKRASPWAPSDRLTAPSLHQPIMTTFSGLVNAAVVVPTTLDTHFVASSPLHPARSAFHWIPSGLLHCRCMSHFAVSCFFPFLFFWTLVAFFSGLVGLPLFRTCTALLGLLFRFLPALDSARPMDLHLSFGHLRAGHVLFLTAKHSWAAFMLNG